MQHWGPMQCLVGPATL